MVMYQTVEAGGSGSGHGFSGGRRKETQGLLPVMIYYNITGNNPIGFSDHEPIDKTAFVSQGYFSRKQAVAVSRSVFHYAFLVDRAVCGGSRSCSFSESDSFPCCRSNARGRYSGIADSTRTLPSCSTAVSSCGQNRIRRRFAGLGRSRFRGIHVENRSANQTARAG